MIARYSVEEISNIWSDDAKFSAWLKVELAAAAAFNKLGVVPDNELLALRKNARFNKDEIYAIERETKHDVVAFTRALSLHLGDEKKWIHYGLTSTDVVDTAQALLLKNANEIIEKDLSNLMQIIAKQAKKYKHTMQIGRTHGVHAELTTTGLKFAYFYEELRRNKERFLRSAKALAVGKISGAVGTYANVPMEVERLICDELGLAVCPISTQILPRDLHADYISACALLASALERFATEIRHLAKTECFEICEYFDKFQKGSSAMPHKKNPIGCENICGLSRVIRSYLTTAFENINLWHERDISHSSAERIMLPDVTGLLAYMLRRFAKICENLIVNEERMRKNLESSYNLIFSQQLLLTLINKGNSREIAYDLTQKISKMAWDEQKDFKFLVQQNESVKSLLSEQEIEAIFSTDYHLKNVDAIFERLNLA